LSQSRRCPYCYSSFLPSAYRAQQSVCGRPECQRRRRSDYYQKKPATDPEYFQVVRDSQKQWWDEHPDYQKQHRQQNPQLVESNRQRQRLRDRKRRVELLVRNNLALDLKYSASEVWLLGPSKVCDLDRNNLPSAFGNAYRLSDANWNKLRRGNFYNPWQHRSEINGLKLMMFHAKDDPNVPYEGTREFAEITGAKLKSLSRGGHISTDYVVRKYWAQIKKFFDSARTEKHSALSPC